MFFTRKDFINLKELSKDEINIILNTAETMKFVLSQNNKKAPHLQGKTVILFFYEKNSRTMLSYSLAAQHLSANIVDMKEFPDTRVSANLTEIGKLIDQLGADFIIIRHPMSGAAKLLAEHTNASVINAGDGFNENPSQSLLDIMTIKNVKGHIDNLIVTIIGDITHSRVAMSNIWGLLKLGAEVRVSGPPTLIPPEIEKFGVKVYHNLYEAATNADVILPARMLPISEYGILLPSFREYTHNFIVDEILLEYAKPDAIVMHPGPVKTGVEISPAVVGSSKCYINDQISNGVAVRMAILYLISLKGGENLAVAD